MIMKRQSNIKVEKRSDQFAQKIATRISKEIASKANPYNAERCLIRGYDQVELARRKSFSDIVYLVIQGELPTKVQAEFFESVLVALCNPGPRHPATRAAMNAGAGKSKSVHILPIALSILGGAHLGGEEVEASMRFIRKRKREEPQRVAQDLVDKRPPPNEGDFHVAPGFGQRFGDIDVIPDRVARLLLESDGAGRAMNWSNQFVEVLKEHGYGWLTTGVAAAAFVDLGFHPRAGGGLFQIIASPSLLAHGIELLSKPMTAFPFIDNEHYFIEE